MSTNALAALVTFKTLLTEYWTEKTLEEIVLLGQQLLSEREFDLSCDFRISKSFSKIEFEINPFMQDTLDRNFTEIMTHYLNVYQMGIIVTDLIILSLWRESGNFYVYFPPTIEDVSFVIKFTSVKCLGKFIVDKISMACLSFKLKTVKLIIKN